MTRNKEGHFRWIVGRLSRDAYARSLRKTPVILAGILDNVSQERAQQATDGPDGWNGIEIVGHLLDYEEIFFERAKRMLAEDKPALEGYDQDALVKDHDYAHQNLQDVFQRFVTLRRETILERR